MFTVLRSIWRQSRDELCSNDELVNNKKCRCFKKYNRYFLKNSPKVFTFLISWALTENQPVQAECTLKLLYQIPSIFEPKSLFSKVPNDIQGKEITTPYFFKGMVCFSSKHYFGYYREFPAKNPERPWYQFNDKEVTQNWVIDKAKKRFANGTWQDVIDKCILHRERPIMLIFEEVRSSSDQHSAKTEYMMNEKNYKFQDFINPFSKEQITDWPGVFRYARDKDEDIRKLNGGGN